jgi:hypothetical protein
MAWHCPAPAPPFELIARQLRQRDVAMVAKVYGHLKPDTEERDPWARIAAARETDRNSI